MKKISNASAPRVGRKQWIVIAAILIVGAIAAAFILMSPVRSSGEGDGHGHSEAGGHGDEHGHSEEGGEHADHEGEEKAAKGPNGGDQLTDGDQAAEVLLSEAEGEPRLAVWLSRAGQAVAGQAATLTLKLVRPDGSEQEMPLRAQADGRYVSAEAIPEPHVFEATLIALVGGEPFLFTFSRDEGKVAMSDAQVRAAGVSLATAEPAPIRSGLQLPGEIRFNADRTAHVVPRVAGVVERVAADLGQQVRKGQVLAVLSSVAVSEMRAELQTAEKRRALAETTYQRERSLWEQKISPEQDVLQARQAFDEAAIAVANARQKLATLGAATGGTLGQIELRAPFDGMVVEKHIALGEAVREDSNVFTISDLSSVWAEFNVAARDLPQVRVGERVNVRATSFDAQASGKVTYVGALVGEQTRTAPGRVALANPQLAWRPGLFVNVELIAQEAAAPVTVPADALQSIEDQPVVFLRVPGGFVPLPVKPGRSDGKRVEILGGLQAGASVAAAGSFIVKSEQGKGSATHTH
tara:strand:+ start:4297 stop:5868 length:1572 start_codon:yes stop_codon:yes gene_type:complete